MPRWLYLAHANGLLRWTLSERALYGKINSSHALYLWVMKWYAPTGFEDVSNLVDSL